MRTGHVSHAPSIAHRLTRSALLCVLLGALASAAAAALAVSFVVKAVMDSALEETAQALVVLAERDHEIFMLARGHTLPAAPHRETLMWQLRSRDGALIARSHDAPAQPWLVPLAAGHQRAMGLAVFSIAGPRSWLQVAHPLTALRRARWDAALQAGSAVLLLGLLAAAAVAWRIRRELQPVAQLARDVEEVNPGPVAPRLPRSPRLELEPVYAALERLLQRLAQNLRSEDAFAAHAAHSLRTPLAGLSAQLEVAKSIAPVDLQPRLGLALDSARRLAGVIDALLTMARAGGAIHWHSFAATELGTVALGRDIDVDLAALECAPSLNGDSDLLAAAVANLVDNAARHGAARVRLAAAVDDNMQHIEIADDGPGVPPERMAELRDALARLERTGAIEATLGLGLTLAAAVVRAHGGRIDLDCRQPPVQGFCARLSWPRTPPNARA